ncbi:hypothetical protein [Rubrivirga marina]|uniref:Uncharacterized protein n=1 Tax=Rubrivirga marina TaxID=1196024 RepID=A0A271J5R9_9BACT|nr:hypothetical protein [Rubrivirga marina]PAP78424.1 hypothetical protein BSZ37_19340 [Rubrivirga marina]
MTRLPDRLHCLGVAVLIGLGVAFAADAQTPEHAGLDARLDRLTQGLDLTAEQTSSLEDLAERYADAERADLWAAAADVSSILTDAQIDQLQQAAEARGAERREGRGERGQRRAERRARPDGERPTRGRRQRADRPYGDRGERVQLTEEQRDALRAIRSDARERIEALVTQFRAGDLSEDQFVARTKALRDEAVRQSVAALPAEAAQRLGERLQQRDAETAAREAALDLTEAQKATFQSRMLDRVREGRPDLHPYLDENGQFDRDALREAQRERREAARAEREALRERADPLLTDEQKAIVAVHRALTGGERGREVGRRVRPGPRGK